MLNVFTLANGRLFQEEIESLEELAQFKPIWVDLEDPTPEERRWVKQHFGLSIPEDAMDEDIEESARFFEEDNGELHIRSDFLIDDDEQPRAVRVAFILNQHNTELRGHGVLFSIHDEDVPVFRLLRMRARRAPGLIEDAKEVLLKLFDADAEYSADTLENIYDELEKVSKQVLAGDVTDALAGEVLGAIARQEDLNGRIRRNVMDTRRAVSFMMRSRLLNAEQFEEARQILAGVGAKDLSNLTAWANEQFDPKLDWGKVDSRIVFLVTDASPRTLGDLRARDPSLGPRSVGALAAPAMAKLVQQRRFVALVPQGQVPWWKSLGESFRLTAVAVLAFVLTLPLWLLPPVAGLVVPLVWGWLAYRVMTLDVLADWASEQELAALLKQHRGPLMFMGVASGYMGSMPAMLWAAGGVLSFALAPVLVLVSVWLYTLVFCLTGLWFAHYLMQALHQLRSRQVPVEGRAWLG